MRGRLLQRLEKFILTDGRHGLAPMQDNGLALGLKRPHIGLFQQVLDLGDGPLFSDGIVQHIGMAAVRNPGSIESALRGSEQQLRCQQSKCVCGGRIPLDEVGMGRMSGASVALKSRIGRLVGKQCSHGHILRNCSTFRTNTVAPPMTISLENPVPAPAAILLSERSSYWTADAG